MGLQDFSFQAKGHNELSTGECRTVIGMSMYTELELETFVH